MLDLLRKLLAGSSPGKEEVRQRSQPVRSKPAPSSKCGSAEQQRSPSVRAPAPSSKPARPANMSTIQEVDLSSFSRVQRIDPREDRRYVRHDPEFAAGFLLFSSAHSSQKVLAISEGHVNRFGTTHPKVQHFISDVKRYEGGAIQISLIESHAFDVAVHLIASSHRVEKSVRNEDLFDALIQHAYINGVSDIHILCRSNKSAVKLRELGQLRTYKTWTYEEGLRFTRYVYGVLGADASTETFYPDRMNSARALRRVKGEDGRMVNVDVRMQTAPLQKSEVQEFFVVFRLLQTDASGEGIRPLESLGYEPLQVELLRTHALRKVGVVVLTGITGSGKTFTLASLTKERLDTFGGKENIITIEDPVEIVIPGANQMALPRAEKEDGLSERASAYSGILSGVLRLDPDVLLIGEIRDAVSAEAAVKCALSGHMVFTTAHTPSCFAVPARLRDLGVANSVLGSSDFLSLLVNQKLVRTVCQHCSYGIGDARVPSEVLSNIEKLIQAGVDMSSVRIEHEDGCAACHGGASGREVVAQVVSVDDSMRLQFEKGTDAKAHEKWLETGGMTVDVHAALKTLRGRISLNAFEQEVCHLSDPVAMKAFQKAMIIYGAEKDVAASHSASVAEGKVFTLQRKP